MKNVFDMKKLPCHARVILTLLLPPQLINCQESGAWQQTKFLRHLTHHKVP